MALRDWLLHPMQPATATVATTAIHRTGNTGTVARVATVSVASLQASDAERIREAYEERAAIKEYDGGLSRGEAERQAWAVTLEAFGLPAGYRLH